MAAPVNFLDEEEVKEYLDNIGTEYSYQCYRERQPEGCHMLAEYFDSIRKNFEAAAKILKANCEQNELSESCFKLGTYYVTGKGGLPADLKAAYNCFLKSCNKGGKKSIHACNNVGLLLQDGRAIDEKPDTASARNYYEKACEGNYAASCFNLGVMYLQGDTGIAKDMSKALYYSEKACNLEHIWGCVNASRMYKLGDGVSQNDAKAETLKNRAIELHRLQKEGVSPIKFGE